MIEEEVESRLVTKQEYKGAEKGEIKKVLQNVAKNVKK
jgi:hypothetical protein